MVDNRFLKLVFSYIEVKRLENELALIGDFTFVLALIIEL